MSRPLDFPLLADENIRPEVATTLAGLGRNIRTVHEENLAGASDVEILRRARALGRVVLTHDSDFGRLAIQSGEPIIGIICLRPGHISPAVVLETFAAVDGVPHDVSPPFIVVAARRGDAVRIRFRQL